MNVGETKFEPISPESLDESFPVKETSEHRENQKTREKIADGSYVEGEAKVLDLSTGQNQEKNSLETNLNEKFALHFSLAILLLQVILLIFFKYMN